VHYSDNQSKQFLEQVAERARTVPGVKTVALTSSVPMANDIGSVAVIPEGFQFPVGKDNARVVSANVDEFFFDAMGLTLLEGRGFRHNDDADAPRVAIVNQQFAQHYWPNQDPVGKRFRLADKDKAWVQIVGLAKTSKYIFIAEPPSEFVYLPYRQRGRQQQMVLMAESSGDSASLAAPLREIVRGLDPSMPIYNVRTMERLFQMRATSIFNVLITLVGSMGLMGLALAIVGLYGLVAYAVSRRTREIGIRMAIGADRAVVLRMILRQGLLLASVGLVVGLAVSVGAGRAMRALFPSGNNERDVAALLIVIPVVLGVTFLAAYLPARRASRVNPVQALRCD
jgi:predicted permease